MGRTLTRLGTRPDREVAYVPGELCVQIDGFSLHARVRVPPGDLDRLEHLCRYAARPAIAIERLSISRQGNVLYRFRRPWRDGYRSRRPPGVSTRLRRTGPYPTHMVFEPLVFLAPQPPPIAPARPHADGFAPF